MNSKMLFSTYTTLYIVVWRCSAELHFDGETVKVVSWTWVPVSRDTKTSDACENMDTWSDRPAAARHSGRDAAAARSPCGVASVKPTCSPDASPHELMITMNYKCHVHMCARSHVCMGHDSWNLIFFITPPLWNSRRGIFASAYGKIFPPFLIVLVGMRAARCGRGRQCLFFVFFFLELAQLDFHLEQRSY